MLHAARRKTRRRRRNYENWKWDDLRMRTSLLSGDEQRRGGPAAAVEDLRWVSSSAACQSRRCPLWQGGRCPLCSLCDMLISVRIGQFRQQPAIWADVWRNFGKIARARTTSKSAHVFGQTTDCQPPYSPVGRRRATRFVLCSCIIYIFPRICSIYRFAFSTGQRLASLTFVGA